LHARPFRNFVKPVSNAIAVLRHLGKLSRPATATQIARHLAINTSTCFNILRTLVFEGLIDFDEATKSYSLGIGVVKLAEGALTGVDRVALIKPKLREVAERYGITLMLWHILGGDRMILLAVENSSANLQIHVRPGQHLPSLIGASGRVVANYLGLTKQQLKEKFRELRWARRISFEEYWRDVRQAAKTGWAADDGYFSFGCTTVAAPIFNSAGDVTHSISAIMFRGQHPGPVIKRIALDLIESAEEAKKALS
jgi:DNA-binding IclR family transcriptional regulator